MDTCLISILLGIILLLLSIGSSVRFKIGSFLIPGGLGAILIAFGIMGKIIVLC
ncbi:MAG: hypothetical protein WC867_00335 [Candidatus Pacearchaeota archaeon]|jgi:hypothetical protein